MDEEALKRNTDCVYFLASPFTCKKGVECEYRHSEMARLNPRDCWYWLSGNCLNPTCAFRHPPLDVHTEVSSEAAPSLLNQSSAPATKTTVPCYFYHNGFCNKGSRCPFLHESDGTYARKPKMANTLADTPMPPLDAKTSGKANTELESAKKHTSSSEMAILNDDVLRIQQNQQVQQSRSNEVSKLRFTEGYVPVNEEPAAAKMVQPAEDLVNSDAEPSLYSDQSSLELIDGSAVQDEWWESSPGFDVLVDGNTEEDLAYEDDPEYLHPLDGGDVDQEGFIMRHGYADENDYDERVFLRDGLYDPSENLDEGRVDLGKYSPLGSRDRRVGCVLSHKRKLLTVEFPAGGRNNVDLREYLRKRRMVDGYRETSRRNNGYWETSRRNEGHKRRKGHASDQRFHRRIASEIERDGIGLARRRTPVDPHYRGRPVNSRCNRSRDCDGVRRNHQISSENRRRLQSNRDGESRDSIPFAGPKSLDEIKGKRAGCFGRKGSVDFDGPKPLSEILKDKKKTMCT